MNGYTPTAYDQCNLNVGEILKNIMVHGIVTCPQYITGKEDPRIIVNMEQLKQQKLSKTSTLYIVDESFFKRLRRSDIFDHL